MAAEDPDRLRFIAAPGPSVVVGINDVGDRFRLTLNKVAVVEPDAPLPNLPVACAVWEPEPDFATSAEAWILAGGPHHTVLSTAVGTPEFRDLAAILSTELVVIDESTTIPAVQNELRWSAAYHRLAARL